MIKCAECGHKLYKETKYMNWLKLMNFIHFLRMENYIEEETEEEMTNALMNFKYYIDEDLQADLDHKS